MSVTTINKKDAEFIEYVCRIKTNLREGCSYRYLPNLNSVAKDTPINSERYNVADFLALTWVVNLRLAYNQANRYELSLYTGSAHTYILVDCSNQAESIEVETATFIEWLCDTRRQDNGAPIYMHDTKRKMAAFVATGQPHHMEAYDYQEFINLPEVLGGFSRTEIKDLLTSYLLSTGDVVAEAVAA